MKLRASLERGSYGYPKRSIFFGSLHGDVTRWGIGIGASYFDDGVADIGLILGRKYFCLELLWGEGKDNE